MDEQLSVWTGQLKSIDAARTALALAAGAAVDSDLLELCRRRIEVLLGARSDFAALAPLSNAEQVCLAFTEQFVIDVAAITDDLVAKVADALGDDGLINFVNAVLVTEQRVRLDLTVGRLMPERSA